MVSHPETGSDSPIGSDRDRGRDTHFCNKLFESLLSKYGVRHHTALAYHP